MRGCRSLGAQRSCNNVEYHPAHRTTAWKLHYDLLSVTFPPPVYSIVPTLSQLWQSQEGPRTFPFLLTYNVNNSASVPIEPAIAVFPSVDCHGFLANGNL